MVTFLVNILIFAIIAAVVIILAQWVLGLVPNVPPPVKTVLILIIVLVLLLMFFGSGFYARPWWHA